MAIVKRPDGIVLLVALVLLAGCAAPVTREAVPEDSTVDSRLPEVEDDPAELLEPSHALAVEALVEQARDHYQQANYSAAIAAAERGLRIDRRTPELYLVLAQSYFKLAMPQQADQFAQQGLRYSEPGTLMTDALLAMREILASNTPLRF